MSGLPFYPHGMNPLLWFLIYLPSFVFFHIGKIYLSLFVWILTPRMSRLKMYKPFLKRTSSVRRTLHRKGEGDVEDLSKDKASSKPPSYWFKVAKYQMNEERRKK